MTISWSCHVCGRTREDARIGVVSRQATMGGVEVKHSLRFCNDSAECMNRADEWAEWPDPYAWEDGLVKIS